MEFQSDVILKDWTWWKIGGPAEHFCRPTNLEDLREALAFARSRELPITVLGGGTNVLVSDLGIRGLVIAMKDLKGVESSEEDGRLNLTALAGTAKSELTKIFLKRKMAPALFLCGLPGDIGGGVVMNAGVAEAITPREFVEITDWIEVMSLDGNLRRFTRDDLEWTYRHTSGWQPGIVARVGLSWALEVDVDLPRKVKDATKNRLARQPLELPSCGSTFKNPPGHKAGALIEQAGLKGFAVGGAQISPKHANFIVNRGGATSADIETILAKIISEVRTRFGVELETEVKRLG